MYSTDQTIFIEVRLNSESVIMSKLIDPVISSKYLHAFVHFYGKHIRNI